MTIAFPIGSPVRVYTDRDGQPLENGYVWFGVANQNPETNPVTMYWDSAATLPVAQPVRTVNGYASRQGSPANVYATGDFSTTVRDSNMTLVLTNPVSPDLQFGQGVLNTSNSAVAIGLGDAGGFYTTDNVEAALQEIASTSTPFISLARLAADAVAKMVPTGARIGYTGTTAPTGWVLAAGRTIGSATSGATERANADTSALFTLLWNSYANTELAIQDSGGAGTTRGASASADFTANKRLPLPDYRGRVGAGLDNMGGSGTVSRLTAAGSGITGTTLGVAGGTQTHTLITGELASHSHTITDVGHTHTVNHTHTITDTGHTHSLTAGTTFGAAGGGTNTQGVTGSNTGSSTTGITINSSTPTSSSTNTGITGTNTAGSGTAHQNTQPTIIETVIIKL